MFQRIQTVYIFIAALVLVPLHYFTIWTVAYGNLNDDEIVKEIFVVKEHFLADIPLLACVALLLIALFLFKNRPMQMQLLKGYFLSMAVFGLASMYIIRNLKAPIFSIISEEYQVILILPISSFVLIILAYLQIKKDEKASLGNEEVEIKH
jgi:Domain of unknown function (DUF4293)